MARRIETEARGYFLYRKRLVQEIHGPLRPHLLEIKADRQAGGLLEGSHQVALADTACPGKIGNRGAFGTTIADEIDKAPELPG